MVQPRTRAPLTHDQRTFVRVAARQLEIEQLLLAAEETARKPKKDRRTAPQPEPLSPAEARRRRATTCPSRSRYRRHRIAGETCTKCTAFMRKFWAADRAAHPERQQRTLDKRCDRMLAKAADRERLANKPADMAERKAAVMAKFVKDAA